MKNLAQSKLNEAVEKIISKIESGDTKQWFKSWNGSGLPKNFVSKSNYNGFNLMWLLFLQEENEFKTNYWLTFNQVKKLGGTINKGAEATPIFFFKMLDINETDEESGEVETKKIPLLRFYNVFNIDQTSLEVGDMTLEVIPDISDFVSSTGAVIKTRSEAYYSPREDYVGMPDISMFKSAEHYTATICHELTHWTAAPTRLDRDLSGRFGSENYAFEELIAELGSCFLCSYFNIEADLRHAEYLESWLKALKAEPKLLWKAASQAQKAFDFLLSLQNNQQTEAA